MKTLQLSTLSVAALAAFALAVQAQEPPPSQYEHLKSLDPFVGLWVGDLDAPDAAENARAFASVRWASNKSYLQFQFTMAAGEQRTHMGTIMIGINAKDKQPYSWSFFPDSQGGGKATIEKGKVTITAQGQTIEGVKTSADVRYEIAGDTMTVAISNNKRDGVDAPGFELKLERRQRQRNRN